MPTINQNATSSISLNAGQWIDVKGTGVAVPQIGPTKGQPQTITNFGKVGPFDFAQTVSLTSTSGVLTYSLLEDWPDARAEVDSAGNPTGQLITPSGDVVGGGGAVLVGADKVRSMLAAIRTGGHSRVNLAFHGHSVIQGVCSDDTANLDLTAAQAWRQKSLAAMLSRALNGAVGGAWSGGIEAVTPSQRLQYTLGGSASFVGPYGVAGPGGYVMALTAATDTATFVAQGTSVRVYAYASGAGVVARYAVNGGSVQTAAAAPNTPTGLVSSGNTLVWYEFTISGLTAGDSVQLLGPTSGGSTNNYRVYGVDVAYTTSAGISVHRQAVMGSMGAQTVAAYLSDLDDNTAASFYWTAPGSAALRAMQTDSVTTRLGLSGVFNMFDVNDIKAYNFSGQAWGWTLATLERHMRNYITAMAARSMPVIFAFGPLRDPASADTAGTPYTQADIIDLYKRLAEASTNCAYIDLTAEFQGGTLAERYAAQQDTGLIYDSVHPGTSGCGYFGAQRIAAALLAA